MLLETLDVGKNDIMIYSQNIFSSENNFRIIFKNNPKMTAKKISFSDVCMFVSDTTPKTLIIYRLLTSLKDVGIERSKFGFSLIINEELEVIYFDPIYAIKEVESIVEKLNNYDLRFRIQQVGLTSSININGKPSFSEIYSVDLASREAKFQNDKVFVEALFAVDNKGFNETKEAAQRPSNEKKETEKGEIKIKKAAGISEIKLPVDSQREKMAPETIEPKVNQNDFKLTKHSITEDNAFDHSKTFRITIQNEPLKNENIKPKKNIETEKSTFTQFL
ncbi:MAG: hypothetical protein K8H86_00740, partial [Ignavibacteriaceae bacterium]|nr:hypothetical protein [Ignavibacteriaceae bacterium]